MNITPANLGGSASLPPQQAAAETAQQAPQQQQVKSENDLAIIKEVVAEPKEDAAKGEAKTAEAKSGEAKATGAKAETKPAENSRPEPTAASKVEVTTKEILLDKLAELKRTLETRANLISKLPDNIKDAIKDIFRQGALTENKLPEGLSNLLKSQNLTGKQLVALANILDDAARILGDKQASAQLTQLLAKLLPETPQPLLINNQQKLAGMIAKLNNQEMSPKQLMQTLQTLLGEVLSQNTSLASNAKQLAQLLLNQNQLNQNTALQLPPDLVKLAQTVKQPDLSMLWTLIQNQSGNKAVPQAQQQLLELVSQFMKGQQAQNTNPNQAQNQAPNQTQNQVPGQTMPQVPNQAPPQNTAQILTQILTQNPNPALNSAPNPSQVPNQNQVLNQTPAAQQPAAAQNTSSAPGQIQFQEALRQILPNILTPQNLKLLEQGTFLKQLANQNASLNTPPQLAQMAKEANLPQLLQLWNLTQTLTTNRQNFNLPSAMKAEQNLNQLASNLLSGSISLANAKNNIDILLDSFKGFRQFGAEEENLARGLLKQTLTSMPPQIQQARYNLPELPRAWLMVKLAGLEANMKEQAAAELRITANNVRALSTIMQRSSVTPAIEQQSGNTVLSFSTPLYFGEGQAYPANIHIYQEYAEGGSVAGRRRKKNETWVRITLDTENIGNVDTFFRLYDDDKLDVRVRFQEHETASEFGEFLPEIRRAMQESPLELTDLSIRSAN